MNYAMYTSDEYLQRLIYKLYKMFISRDTHLLRQYIGVTETEILHWLQSTVDARDVASKGSEMGVILGGRRLVFLEINISEKKTCYQVEKYFSPRSDPEDL